MNETTFFGGSIRGTCLVLAALAYASVLMPSLNAQTMLEAGPLVGYYRPAGHFEPASLYSIYLPARPSNLSGTAWGGNARLWFGRRFGVEASGSTTSSMVGGGFLGPNPGGGGSPGGVLPPQKARVLTLAAEVLYSFSAAPGRYRAWVGVGPGLVRHDGAAYAQVGSLTDLAEVASAGATVRLLPHLAAVGQLATALYNYDIPMPIELQGTPGELQAGLQEDLFFCIGLAWTLR